MNANYHLEPEAVVQSLHEALITTHDFTQARIRLKRMISHMPEGNLQICPHIDGVSFYEKRKYLRKKSDRLYTLAKKRYYETLLNAIDEYDSRSKKREQAFDVLADLIRKLYRGHLNLERIILSRQQYKWFYGRYPKKTPPDYDDFKIPQGDNVRSKSEQQIGIEEHLLAVPCHYEQRLEINVRKQVQILEDDLRKKKQLRGRLFSYHNNSCYWNVPEELSWMNAPGSVWHTYDSRTGCITLHPDYTIMLADGSFLYWEHEGLFQHFHYRMNAQERVGTMELSGIPESHIIRTSEQQANDRETLQEIIRTRILPHLWF